MKLIYVLVASILFALCMGDIYCHICSNNRLNERSATRANNNRLFDSQNNARGSRNVGEGGQGVGQQLSIAYDPNEQGDFQYAPTFFERSEFIIPWTNQHGCGGNASNDPHNTNCNIVIQYTCKAKHDDPALDTRFLRDGSNTGTPGTNNELNSHLIEPDGTGYHENTRSYRECQLRKRDEGIFTATQNLNGDTEQYTRQNAGGNRSGLECPFERDYYPIPRPTIWRDVAYLTSEIGNTNIDICTLVQTESQNVKEKYRCTGTEENHFRPNTEAGCDEVGGTWTKTEPWGIDPPECLPAEWTRDNHLGNTREGHYQNYTWVLPTIEEALQGTAENPASFDLVECVFRMRYNITTGDYDPWNTFADSNGDASPVKNNPTVDLGIDPQGLNIALNTAQTGRTFQDRSHVFTIRRRKTTPLTSLQPVVKNLYVIGKRGNIVQTFPAVEYYQMPADLTIYAGQFIHIQWWGSNSHNNGPNGGDGQTGDDGQGPSGLDRNNFLLTYGEGYNWPIPLDKDNDTLFDHSDCWRVSGANTITPLNRNECAITLATSGYYTSPDTSGEALDNQLVKARPSLIGGVLLRPNKPGVYTYFCSRNNNFTNRSQKGVIRVLEAP